MARIKYSRQREAIKSYLKNTKLHPTANIIYEDLSREYPNISLGTVYRNLNFLVENGEIIRLHCGEDGDRFDADTSMHYHFLCRICHQVSDLKIDPLTHINTLASIAFDGEIEEHSVFFKGVCGKCKQNCI